MLYSIKERCNTPSCSCYKYYGGRGIKCLITADELKQLWIRDNARLMKKPSIDRINKHGNYELNNCQFLEFKNHLSKDISKPILQFSLDDQFIKEWLNAKEASKALNCYAQNIGKCCLGKRKIASGYKWKFK